MVWYNPTTWFQKEQKETTTNVPAPQPQSVRAVDVGTKETTRTGGYTVSGGNAWGGGGGGTTISSTQNITPAQAQAIETARADTFTTTKETGTNYNPATKVQEGPKQSVDLNKAISNKINAVNQITEPAIDSRTGKPFGTLTPAPTTKQRFISSISQSGPVSGTLNFLSSGAVGFYERYSQQRKDFYQTNAIENLIGSGIRVAPYFTSAGPYLLVGGAAETFIFPGGKESIRQTELSLIGKGFAPSASKIISYGIPVGEFALGSFGIKSQVSNMYRGIELTAIEKNPVFIKGIRYEDLTGGRDIFIAAQKTSRQNIAFINQPFFKSGEDKITLESGQGIAYSFKGNKYTASIFESGGRGRVLDTPPKITINMKNFKVSGLLPDVQSSIGRTFVQPTSQAQFKISRSFSAIDGGLRETLTGTIKPVEVEKTWKNFIGLSKENEGTIKLIGAKAERITFGNTIKILGKPKIYGKLKRITLENPDIGNIGSGTILKTNFKGGGGYTETLAKQAFASTITPAKTSYAGSGSLFNLPKSKTPTQLISVSTSTMAIQETKTRQLSIPIAVTETLTKTKSGYGALSFAPVVSSYERTAQIPVSISAITPALKSAQKTSSIPRFASPLVSTPYFPEPKFNVPFLPLALPGGEFKFGLGVRKYKGKQPKKYTPSFESFLFNIRGKKPRGKETGIRIRPITPGFKLAYKLPKLKLRL